MRKILTGGGAPPFPPVGKNPIYIYKEMDDKICQNIKPPTPTHIPFSVQLSTWGGLED